MHSNKMVLALCMGMMMTSTWAESNPTTTTASVEEKTTAQPDTTTSSEPQVEVKVEDIDAPVFE